MTRDQVREVVLAIAAAAVFAALVLGWSGWADAKPVRSGTDFTCSAVAVWDGDGPVWCAEGPRLRLAGIAARETDGTCLPHHPCPAAGWEAARDALVRLLGGARGKRPSGHVIVASRPMVCRSVGNSYGRTVARCRLSNWRDLSDAMIHTGTVLRW